jgi:hypothetical protein
MFLKFFKGTGPGVIFLITVAFLAVWISAFVHPVSNVGNSFTDNYMPLYRIMTGAIGSGQIISTIVSFSMAAVLLFLLINFNTTIFFINERTFLPALLFTLIVVAFPEYQTLNAVLPASLFLMLSMKRIMDGYHKQGVAYNFFDAGILISTGSLFYANLLWFGVVVIIGIILLRTLNISEIAVSLLGLITPYLITFGLYYVLGYDLKELLSLIYSNLFNDIETYSFPRLTIVTLVFEAVIILISIGDIIMLQNTKKIKSRKTFSLLIWVFVISMTLYFIMPSVSVEMVWLAGIPASYFLSHYFIFSRRKVVSEIFFTILFLLVLLIQCLYIIG